MRYTISKRAISLVLSLIMVISMCVVGMVSTGAATSYYVAGTMNDWNTTATPMTQAVDASGTTIYYAGPFNTQYQFKVVDGTNWYGTEIMTNSLYNTSLNVYNYGDSGNVWPDVSDIPYYIVLTVSTSGKAISCVTALPFAKTGVKPTIYVRDASASGFALWGWTADNSNIFSDTWESRPTSASVTADENGWYAFETDLGIGLNTQYSLKVTQGTSTSNSDSWFECVAHGDFYIDIDGEGKPSFYEYNPDAEARTKANAFADALWVDTLSATVTDDADLTGLVKWYEKAPGEYYLYLPSGMDLTAVPVYFSYSALSIGGVEFESGETLDLSVDTEYSVIGDVEGTLYIMQSSNVYTMYMTGNTSLPDATSTAIVHKDMVERKGGNIYTTDETGALVVQDTVSKIKGRGNSSWEASQRLYGKYAFNLTTSTKTKDITGGDVKTKKFSMLANNADEAMMRNLVAYSLADAIGLDYTPQLRIYDFYDNGNYLGTYTVCEKVEVGSSGLLSGITSLDDANEEVNPNWEDEEQMTNGLDSKEPGFYKYVDTPDPEDITGGYLLEFELSERFDNEVSGFVSNEGQPVVVKYPEFATKNEVLYIMDLFNKAEAAIYDDNADINEIAKYIDVESFAKMYIIQEISKNIDAAQTSFYIYKESDLTGDGKLHASPVWDYDWTLGGYSWDRDVAAGEPSLKKATGWTTRYRYIDNNTSKDVNFQAKLCACPEYWDLVQSVWATNAADTVATYTSDDITAADSVIANLYAQMKDSAAMNESRWGFIEKDLTVSWGSTDTGETYYDVVAYLNDWLSDRTAWIGANIGANDAATPTLNVVLKDEAGAVAEGTVDAPATVVSDVTINIDTDAAVIDFTVNGEAVEAVDGKYTIPVAEDGVTEVTYSVTVKDYSIASTDVASEVTVTGTYYVTKATIALLRGDADLDGAISILDATKIQMYCAAIEELSDTQLLTADANANGTVSIMDATHIQRYIAELSCSANVGTPVA